MRKIFNLTAGLNIWVMNQIFGLIKKLHDQESNPHIEERTNVQTPYRPGYEGFILVQIHLYIARLFSACYTILGHQQKSVRIVWECEYLQSSQSYTIQPIIGLLAATSTFLASACNQLQSLAIQTMDRYDWNTW